MRSPVEVCQALGKQYPGAWRAIEDLRRRRRELGDWPKWCYCPVSGARAVVAHRWGPRTPADAMMDTATLAAASAWRQTQGIYRYEPAMRDALWHTPLAEELPVELLYRLPEWCPYLDLGGKAGIDGAWVYLEWNIKRERPELRYVTLSAQGPMPIILHLDRPTLTEAIEAAFAWAEEYLQRELGIRAPKKAMATVLEETIKLARPLLSLTLYLCSAEPDILGKEQWPRKPPRPRKTKRGLRARPPASPAMWTVGERIGAALRLAEQQEPTGSGGQGESGAGRATPRPHIRRAHWHTYLVGKGRARRELRWVHPVLVSGKGIVPTSRKVDSKTSDKPPPAGVSPERRPRQRRCYAQQEGE